MLSATHYPILGIENPSKNDAFGVGLCMFEFRALNPHSARASVEPQRPVGRAQHSRDAGQRIGGGQRLQPLVGDPEPIIRPVEFDAAMAALAPCWPRRV